MNAIVNFSLSFEPVGDTTATTHLLHLELTCPYVICLYYIQTIASIIYIKRHSEKLLFLLFGLTVIKHFGK